MHLKRYIESNKTLFILYKEENNVRNRIGIKGGVIFGRKKYRKDRTIYTNVPTALTSCYTHVQSLHADTWVILYDGLIDDALGDVEVVKIYDVYGVDITEWAQSISVDAGANNVTITMQDRAFEDVNNKVGSVLLCNAIGRAANNFTTAIIEVSSCQASVEITENTFNQSTYRWLKNDVFVSNESSVSTQNLALNDMLKCEVYKNGVKVTTCKYKILADDICTD